jgi:acetyl esterase/lipase
MGRHFFVLTVLLGLLAAQPAWAQGLVDRDVPYGNDPAEILDLYHPAGAGPAHLVVFLHGGGWVAGQKNIGRLIAPPLVARGYAVASLGYRLYPQATPAGAAQDAANGIAYLLRNAARFGLSPGRFALIGHSSGAHMVALLGTDAGYLRRAGLDPASLAAVITLDGVFDVHANLTDFPNQKREAVFGDDPAGWKQVSPVDLLDTASIHPRFCLVHEDTNARFVEQEALFAAALARHGAPAQSVVAHGLTHGDLVQEFSDAAAPMAPFALSCLTGAFGLN